MECKKPIVFDSNSWLVSQLEQRFLSIKLTNGVSLWDALVSYFRPQTGECDYLFDQYNDNSLYPRLYYRRDTHTLFLEGFEWVSPQIKSLLINDFFTPELIADQSNINQEKSQLNSSVKPKKRGFFQRLFGINKQPKVDIDHKPKVSGDLALTYLDQLILPDPVGYSNNISIDSAAETLSHTNGFSLTQAREALYKKSYRQLTSCTNFMSRLENEKLINNGTAKVYLDLSFLQASGFFNLPETKEFRSELTTNLRTEWLLEVKEFTKNLITRSDDGDLLDL